MPTFTPPVNGTEVPPVALDTRGPVRRLMRHYGGNPRGVNVYLLSDGTATETDPDSVNVFWSAEQLAAAPIEDQDGLYVTRALWSAPAEPYELTAAEVTALEDAGYEVTP